MEAEKAMYLADLLCSLLISAKRSESKVNKSPVEELKAQPVKLNGPPKKVQRKAVRDFPPLSGLGWLTRHSSLISVYSIRCTAEERRYSLSESDVPNFSQMLPLKRKSTLIGMMRGKQGKMGANL